MRERSIHYQTLIAEAQPRRGLGLPSLFVVAVLSLAAIILLQGCGYNWALAADVNSSGTWQSDPVPSASQTHTTSTTDVVSATAIGGAEAPAITETGN